MHVGREGEPGPKVDRERERLPKGGGKTEKELVNQGGRVARPYAHENSEPAAVSHCSLNAVVNVSLRWRRVGAL